MKKHDTKKGGFSLIELLVSVSLFTVVLTVAIGSLLVLIGANNRAQSMQQIMSDLSFAIDSISREVRTGRGLYCNESGEGIPSPDMDQFSTKDCEEGVYLSIYEGGQSLTAGESSNRITFRYNSSDERIERRLGDSAWYPITATDVHVTDMFFYVADSATGDSGNEVQANATVYIEGYVGDRETDESSFAIQTTISRRIIDII